MIKGTSYEKHHHVASSNTNQAVRPNVGDVRQASIFNPYGGPGYQDDGSGGSIANLTSRTGSAVPAKRRIRGESTDDGLFPDIPEARKRKFILVEDNMRGSRLRVRVTLNGVDTNEIPDSFRRAASVFPRSFFPREMQNPPPSAIGSHFFSDDVSDDGTQETSGRDLGKRSSSRIVTKTVRVPLSDGRQGEVVIPGMQRSRRAKEFKLNELAHSMAWLQSRVFAGRTMFLQRACKLTLFFFSCPVSFFKEVQKCKIA